jgi:hypothetical protein
VIFPAIPPLPESRGPWQHPAAMDLSSCLNLDPHLLVGLVNTELRNHCESLDDLVKTHGIDEASLVERLAAADYAYQPGQNQFR